MSKLGAYILSVGAAALITGIMTSFTDNKDSMGVLIRMVCGLFLAFAVIKPMSNLNFDDLSTFAESYTAAGTTSAAAGQKIAEDTIRDLIKQKTEAYILDKACLYNADLEVEVTLGGGNLPVPESVCITGHVSPYARTSLQQILSAELNIPKERQLWIG